MSFKLDEADLLILNELQQNSGRPIHELAHQVGISTPSCARRVKRLEENGFIERYVALLNPAALGLDLDVFISIRLNTQTLQSMDEFKELVAGMPEVVECYALTGDSDFLLHVRTPGVKEFNAWMQGRLIGVATIFATHSNISLERIKYSTALPIPLKATSQRVMKSASKRKKRAR